MKSENKNVLERKNGEVRLQNKNTKKWADKYGRDIIKKYRRKGCMHYFEMDVYLSNEFAFGLSLTFRCFTANPDYDNEDGEIVVLVNKKMGCESYCVPGDEIESFLKEYEKIMTPKWNLTCNLMNKYCSVRQQKEQLITRLTKRLENKK